MYYADILASTEASPDASNLSRFFSDYELVVSGHAILSWGIGLSKGINGIKYKQKVPYRIYCGMSRAPGEGVRFEDLETPERGRVSFESCYPGKTDRVVQYLQDFLQEHGYSDGVRIGFFSEMERGHGLSFTGVAGVLMTAACSIMTEKISAEFDREYEAFVDSPEFQQIYAMSVEISQVLSGKRSVGATNYATLLESPLPFICLPNG